MYYNSRQCSNNGNTNTTYILFNFLLQAAAILRRCLADIPIRQHRKTILRLTCCMYSICYN